MVMFSCNRCSKGLKKKDVLNHSFQCGGRDNINVTCIDCLKDFTGNTYDAHTSCISEEVRYGGKGVTVKETGKKQNQWLGIVRQVLNSEKSLDPEVSNFLKSVQHLENIPRQRKKFQNWALSVKHIKNTKFSDRVFDVLQMEFQKNQVTVKTEKKSDDPSAVNGDETALQDGSPSKPMDVSSASKMNGDRTAKKEKKAKETEVEKVKVKTKVKGEKVTEDVKMKTEDKVNKVGKKKVKTEIKGDKVTEVEKVKVTLESNEDEKMEVGENEEESEAENTEDEQVEVKTAPNDSDENGNTNKKNSKTVNLSIKLMKLKEEHARLEVVIRSIEKQLARNGGVAEEEKIGKRNKRTLAENGTSDGGESKPSKKRKLGANDNGSKPADEPVAPSKEKKVKFNWHAQILGAVGKSNDEELCVKEVTKKVINEYTSLYGDKGIHDKLNNKMRKKLKSCPGILVLEEKIKIVDANE